HELVVFRRILSRSVILVVEVLAAAGGIDAGRLQVCRRPRRDPNVFPGRRNRERLDPPELRGIGDRPPSGVEIAKMASRTDAPPSSFPGHDGRDAPASAP